jgi:hypothetical protein
VSARSGSFITAVYSEVVCIVVIFFYSYTYLKKRCPPQTINDKTNKHLGGRKLHCHYTNYSCTLECPPSTMYFGFEYNSTFSLKISSQALFLKYQRTQNNLLVFWMCVKHAGNRDNSCYTCRFFMNVFQNKQSSCKCKWRAMSIFLESYRVVSFMFKLLLDNVSSIWCIVVF